MSAVQQKVRKQVNLNAHKVDYVASLLMSLLIVFGSLVFLLFIYWLTTAFSFPAGGIVLEDETPPGRGDHAAGFERDIEPPGAEEVEVLSEPTLQSSLEAVTDVASTVAASLESVNSNADATVAGNSKGDSRPPGPEGEGDDIVPRYERWDLKFQAKGLKPYAEQIDYFKIELACMGGLRTIDYALNVSGAPQKRSDTPDIENKRQRLYFMWRTDTPLKAFDSQLLNQAGVKTQGRLIVKFIPKELETNLAEIEKVYFLSKGKKSIKEVAKTVFESQSTSNGFQFVVTDQLYR